MDSAAFSLIRSGIAQSVPSVLGFAETGASSGGSAWLQFPSPLPSSAEHLWFLSYESSQDAKRTLVGFENSNIRNGLSQDWNNGTDGFQTPRLKVIIDSGIKDYVMPAQVLGDRLHLLVSFQIVGTDAQIKAYLWDETSGAWTEAINALETGGTSTVFPYGAESGTSLFASLGGQRITDLISYRASFWTTTELSGGLPDISQAAVRNNFTNGLNLVDPAISHSAFGVPLYDIHGPAATYNAGTNLGSGGDFTVNGTFT
ncbi:hypothetical protein [uncultured Roseovarius sp.]|uniref:hypothetical protein n=1 Tax=uncultured Roseovarius sp. TaxID=293344 RepID=UPI00260187BC|nr:hypothetical protein [uncultured Roseovarius sp.]